MAKQETPMRSKGLLMAAVAPSLVFVVLHVMLQYDAEACIQTQAPASAAVSAQSTQSSTATTPCPTTRCTTTSATSTTSVNLLTALASTSTTFNKALTEIGSCTCPSSTGYTDDIFAASTSQEYALFITCTDNTQFCACSTTGECYTVTNDAGLMGYQVATICDPTCNAYLFLDCPTTPPPNPPVLVSTTNSANTINYCAMQYANPTEPVSSTSFYIKLASISCQGCVIPTTCVQCTGAFVASGGGTAEQTAGQKMFLDAFASKQQLKGQGPLALLSRSELFANTTLPLGAPAGASLPAS